LGRSFAVRHPIPITAANLACGHQVWCRIRHPHARECGSPAAGKQRTHFARVEVAYQESSSSRNQCQGCFAEDAKKKVPQGVRCFLISSSMHFTTSSVNVLKLRAIDCDYRSRLLQQTPGFALWWDRVMQIPGILCLLPRLSAAVWVRVLVPFSPELTFEQLAFSTENSGQRNSAVVEGIVSG
jgi:hypothetical protein